MYFNLKEQRSLPSKCWGLSSGQSYLNMQAVSSTESLCPSSSAPIWSATDCSFQDIRPCLNSASHLQRSRCCIIHFKQLLKCPGQQTFNYSQLTCKTLVRPYPVSIIAALALHEIVGIIRFGYVIVRINYDLCDRIISVKLHFLISILKKKRKKWRRNNFY